MCTAIDDIQVETENGVPAPAAEIVGKIRDAAFRWVARFSEWEGIGVKSISAIRIRRPFFFWPPRGSYCRGEMATVGVTFIKKADKKGQDLDIPYTKGDIVTWCLTCDRVYAWIR